MEFMSITIGQRFGCWTVIDGPQKCTNGYRMFCECTCGTQKWIEVGTLNRDVVDDCRCQPQAKKQAGRPPNLEKFTVETDWLLGLIAKQELLPADQFTQPEGAPAWTINSFAAMLGTDVDSLVTFIAKRSGSIG
jgi:hypothetical protein